MSDDNIIDAADRFLEARRKASTGPVFIVACAPPGQVATQVDRVGDALAAMGYHFGPPMPSAEQYANATKALLPYTVQRPCDSEDDGA